MAHARKNIRTQAKTTLTGLTLTGSNVFEGRSYPVKRGALPCICIYTRSETSEPVATGGPTPLLRQLELTLEAHAEATDDIDGLMDDIAEDIEDAMAADAKLGGLVRFCYLDSTEITYDGSGRKRVGTLKMTYQIEYRG